MDDPVNLPVIPTNIHHIWNDKSQKFDVLDLTTGKMYEPAIYEADAYQYTVQMADIICGLVRNGKTLTAISKLPNMPSIDRLYAWSALYPEFRARYREAKKQRADYHADIVHDIAIEARTTHKDFVPGLKLAADLHKWHAEKGNPDEYGKKDEGVKGGNTSINITLHTGVLDSPGPKDIIVDEFGNFKGFDDGTIHVEEEQTWDNGTSGESLGRERFAETEEYEERSGLGSDGTTVRETEESKE